MSRSMSGYAVLALGGEDKSASDSEGTVVGFLVLCSPRVYNRSELTGLVLVIQKIMTGSS